MTDEEPSLAHGLVDQSVEPVQVPLFAMDAQEVLSEVLIPDSCGMDVDRDPQPETMRDILMV